MIRSMGSRDISCFELYTSYYSHCSLFRRRQCIHSFNLQKVNDVAFTDNNADTSYLLLLLGTDCTERLFNTQFYRNA